LIIQDCCVAIFAAAIEASLEAIWSALLVTTIGTLPPKTIPAAQAPKKYTIIFDKEFPDFDWKNTPAYKHPGGKDCPCPKHEYVREQVKFTKQVNETGKDARVTLKFCPEHYNVYMNEVIPAMPMKYKILTKIALKIGAIKVVVLKHMQSDLCFYCRFGSGGHGKKSELPPLP